MQVLFPVGSLITPPCAPTPHPLPQTPTRLGFWVTATRRVTRNWFAPYPCHINHPFITSHEESWRLAKINSSQKKKTKEKRKKKSDHLFWYTRFLVYCCPAACEAFLKLLSSYKLTYTSTIKLSQTIRRHGARWRLAWSCSWKADGVLTDVFHYRSPENDSIHLNTITPDCQGILWGNLAITMTVVYTHTFSD